MLEKTYHFLIKLIQSFLTFLKIIFASKWFPSSPKTNSDSVIILGNGPSLKSTLQQYKEELKSSTLICVNNFTVTEFYTDLRPGYYIICSKEFWSTGAKDGIHSKNRQKMIDALIQKTTWKVTFFIPYGSQSNPSFLNNIRKNPNIKLAFYNTTPIEGLSNFNNLFMELGWGSPRPHNVLIPSILMAINCGFKKIALVGADHSWIPTISVNDNNVALVNKKHFYDEDTAKTELMYKDGIKPRKLHEILKKFMFSFRSYFDLKRFAGFKKTQIYNCTPNSFIDAFERKSIDDFLSNQN